jgi:hypothetical protein
VGAVRLCTSLGGDHRICDVLDGHSVVAMSGQPCSAVHRVRAHQRPERSCSEAGSDESRVTSFLFGSAVLNHCDTSWNRYISERKAMIIRGLQIVSEEHRTKGKY